MSKYVPREFVKRTVDLLNKRIDMRGKTDYMKEYRQQLLQMCVATSIPDSFLADVEEYEQKPKPDLVERIATYLEVKPAYLMYGE